MGALVEDQHVGAVLREHGGGDQPGGAGTDHDDVVGVVHLESAFVGRYVFRKTECSWNYVMSSQYV